MNAHAESAASSAPSDQSEPDGEHLGARPVLRARGSGEGAGDREAQPGEDCDDDDEPRVLVIACDEEDGCARVEEHAEGDGGDEPAAAHRRSERIAEPDSSAFEMNPRAPLPRIIPS